MQNSNCWILKVIVLMLISTILTQTAVAQIDDFFGAPFSQEGSSSSEIELQLYHIDGFDSGVNVSYGAPVYVNQGEYGIRLVRREMEVSIPLFYNIFDIQPDGKITSLFNSQNLDDLIIQPRQKINLDNLKIKFTPPYGRETLMMVLTTKPLLFDPPHARSNQNLYLEDIKWLMNGEIPESLLGKLWFYRFDFEIRSEQAYYDDLKNAEIFENRLVEIEDSLFALYLENKGNEVTTGSDGDWGSDGDGDWGSSGDEDWGGSDNNDQEADATAYVQNVSIDKPLFDVARSSVPPNQVYVNFPLLVMTSPSEPSYNERGGRTISESIKTKGYVVSGNVATQVDMKEVSVRVEVIQNKVVTEAHYLSHDRLKQGAQTMGFECQVNLLPGESVIEVKAMSTKGYAVKESFKVSYQPDSTALVTGSDYLILLGIDNYAKWPKLSNAVNDAQSLKETMISHYSVPPENVFELFNTNCRRSSIDSLMRLLIHRVNPNDRVLVYFAGHGYYDDLMEEGYWITQEADLTDMSSYLSNSTITRYIKSFKSQHTLFIADACFSGTYYFTSRGATTLMDRLESNRSRWMFSSGGKEAVADNYKNSGHSPFAYYLLQYLENPEDKVFPISTLSSSVIRNVSSNTSQVPVAKPLQNAGDESGEFVFRYKP